MASIDRTAYPRFTRAISVRELAEVFTPSAGEIEWARGKTQDDQHFLALLVWLKAYQRLGYFPKLADVPATVAEHIRGAVGLPEGLVPADAAERSAKRHRSFVRQRMGVVYDAAGVRAVAAEAIRKAAQAKDNPADLINVALEELVRKRCELPGYTTLDELTKKIRTEVNRGFFTLVAGRIDAAARARLGRLLVVDPITRRSAYDGLKDVAQAASPGKFKGRLAFLRDLDALGTTEVWLQGVPPGKISHFAGEARVTDVADLRKVLDEDKRLTLIASLLHTVRTGVRDDVVTMFCKRMAAIHKKGRDQLETLREIHRAESERLLGVFGDVLDGVREALGPEQQQANGHSGDASGQEVVAERAGRLVFKALEQAGGLEALAAAHEAVSAHHGNNYLPLLEAHYRSHRSALFTLVESIELESTNADRSVLDAVEYLHAQRGARGAFVPEQVSAERTGPDGDPVTVWLSVDVDAFASAMWRKILKDPDRPGMLVRRHLEVCVFSYLAAELRSGDIAVAGSDSYANPHTQLMSWQECAPLAETFCAEADLPADPAELTGHYRRLLAEIAAEIALAANKHATGEKVSKASTTVVNGFNRLDITSMWGDGKTVAADGSQVETWENNLLAESHIRYGGYGGLAYRHISNTYVALFSHFIPCGVWEAVYIIEGLLRNASEIQPDTIHADTQGQSLPVFGLAALLGFDLLPRIRNWHDLIFYRPDPEARYAHIDSLFGDEVIDWRLIETHWTDLLRTAISIRENRISSVTLLRRLGNHSRKNRLYRAFRELGRAVRTITLLRYLSDPDLREQITAITNRNEAFHGFADWLMFGGKLIPHNDPDYQEKIIKFNELLANCVIYSTACDITDAANAIAAEGHPIDPDDLATISPYITHTIRRFGNWTLNLTPPAAAPTTRLDLEPRVLFAP
ncbi:Tn3 family transposase [Streptosporangium sp. NPDC051023]|uniref:Tn3 family transposase n=1 Tax=Streptosporangium sp. NPDC051023 TaxID=3155410 RepID=UPI00344FB8F4